LVATSRITGRSLTVKFTDSNISNNVSITTVTGTVTAGNSAAYTVNVEFGGNTNACTAPLSISGLPTGAVGSFSPTSVTGASNNTPKTSALTISTTASGASATPAGTYTFTVTVTATVPGSGCNGDNRTATGTLSVTAPSNSPPTVDAGGPYSGTEGSAIDFGSGTSQPSASDPNAGDVLLYKWTYTKGADVDAAATCVFSNDAILKPTFTCTDNGTFTATLEVDDQQGHKVSDNATVNVTNGAPTATGLTTNSPVSEGSPITLELAGVTDPSSVDAASLRYAFDCGTGYGTAISYATAGTANSGSCSTNDNGTRAVKGKVFDKDGDSNEYTANVTINNVAPSATGLTTNSPVNEGSNITLSLANVTDPSTVDVATLHFAFDCGSGYGTAISYATSGTTNSATCPTTDNGTRSVKGKVFDKDEGSNEYTATVTINNVAPTVTVVSTNPSGPLELSNGQVVAAVSVTFTDPAGSADDDYTASIDCGNGDAPISKSDAKYATQPVNVGNCTYTAEDVGFRTITATVTDKDGDSGTKTLQVQVIFDWNGFFQPVDNDNLNVARAGSAIPIKFNLGGYQGLAIFYVGDPNSYPNSSKVNCSAINEDLDTIEETVNAGGSSLTYDFSANQYVYVWKSDKAWAGTCRRLDVKLIDGTTHSAFFKWTK
jgi:hypothetical protein